MKRIVSISIPNHILSKRSSYKDMFLIHTCHIRTVTYIHIPFMNIIMTSVQQNRKKDQVPVNCSQKSYTKLYQVLEAVGSFWPHTSPLIQHKVPAFSLPAIKVETFQDEKKGDDICEQKLSQNPQNFYNVFGGGEKTQCFLFFCGAFFGVVKLLVFLAFRMVPFPCSISSSER